MDGHSGGGSVPGAVMLAPPPEPTHLAAGTGARGPMAPYSAPNSPTNRPPLPPQPKSEEKQKVSRYRTLRGKSVSSIHRGAKKLDVFSDAGSGNGNGNGNGNGDSPNGVGLGVPRVETTPTRRRSRTVGTRSNLKCDYEDPADASSKLGIAKTSETSATGTENGTGNGTSNRPSPFPLPTTNLPLKPRSPNISSPSPSPSPSADARANLKPSEGQRPFDLVRLKEANARAQQLNRHHPGLQQGNQKQGQEPKDHEQEALWADEVARLEAETDRILAEQKKRDLARLQEQLAKTPSPSQKPRPKRLILETFPFLVKKSINGSSQPSTPKSAPAKTFGFPWSPTISIGDRSPSPAAMSFIECGGGGIVPQTDAPNSAVNGTGERRVTVRCLSSTISLPVTTETCPVDIVFSTANLITHKINPATCVVVECYVMLGMERRLRHYEPVRDIMNSWDRDQQNTLLVLSHDTPQDMSDLELASVPKTEDPPTGFTFQMYHSSRPGKWNKRWVTLMDDGRIFAAKRAESKATDKDSLVLCHLSDFDIYTPKESETRRHIRPPKKFCYAIKSQQKTNLFPNGENFVHFFSTEDDKLAYRFYELVQGWRSWYLVNKKIDFQAKEEPLSPSRAHAGAGVKKSMSISRHGTRRGHPTIEKDPYTIGEFQPLIDMTRFDKPLEDFGKDSSERQKQDAAKPNVLSKSRHAAPPANGPQSPTSAQKEFLSGGLLGDAYDKRKQAETTVTDVKPADGPFTEGPSLLNNLTTSPTSPADKPEASSWFPSALEHTARNRPPPKPALRRPQTADGHGRPMKAGSDYAESIRSRPSQRHGVGRGVKPPNGGPLIDFASGGATSDQPIPSRNSSKSSSSAGGQPYSGRPRSRSTATTRSQRTAPVDRPPVPPLPYRSSKRGGDHRVHTDPTSSRHAPPAEPLINRIK